jgi:hypothetical protein
MIEDSHAEFKNSARNPAIFKPLTGLFPTGHLVGLRCPGTRKGTIAGYYDDLVELANDLELITDNKDFKATCCYYNLNPLNTSFKAVRHNSFDLYVKTTVNDENIIHLTNMLLDFDAPKPKGTASGIMATDTEKRQAINQMHDCQAFLEDEYGFPESLVCDSGNGGHLIYRVDLAVEEHLLVKPFLLALKERFPLLDTTAFNPSRVVKAYGTWVRKGDGTKERPHRQSTVLCYPGKKMRSVVKQMIQDVIDGLPLTDKSTKSSPAGSTAEDTADFIARKKRFKGNLKTLDIKQLWRKAGLEIYGERGIRMNLQCPWHDEHSTGDGGTSVFVGEDDYHRLSCLHQTCQNAGRKWIDALEKLGHKLVDSYCEKRMPEADTEHLAADPTEHVRSFEEQSEDEEDVNEDDHVYAQDGYTQSPTSEDKPSPFLADLKRRGIAAVPITETSYQVPKCPCCGVPGTFIVKDHEGLYKCGAGRRSWADGRALWKVHRSNNGFYSVGSVLTTPDPDWLIMVHLPRRSVNLVYGPHEIAKSFFELARAMAVACGIEYLGCETTQGKVVYLYSEGQAAIKRRVKAWLTHHEIAFDDPRLANIAFHFKRYDLSMEMQVESLADGIMSWGNPDLVVIDTLSKNFRSSENEDMALMVAAAYDLVEQLDCSVDIVHHVGKDASRGPRGGSQLQGGVDMSIELQGVRSSDVENEYVGVKVIPQKLKDGRKLAPYFLDYLEYQFSVRRHDHSIVLVPSAKSVEEHHDDEKQRKRADDDAQYHRYLSLFPAKAERASKTKIEAIMRRNDIGQRQTRRFFARAFADDLLHSEPNPQGGEL